ncbi:polysaccharide pyruvyl transferase family protein [bacterium]|nr:polysaccharide pyruvyl transferase family protein [bacterium]
MADNMKLFWCDIDNFGDALNVYIFKKCFGVDVENADLFDSDAMGIGSVLDNILLSTKDLKKVFKILKAKKPIYILSSGFGWEAEHYCAKIRYFKNMYPKRKIKAVALRGIYTKELCEKVFKTSFDDVALGDLGLLASYLIDDTKSEKKYEMGIVPHYADLQSPVFKKILEENPNSIIINTHDNPVEFLNKLNMCKTVVSTGMHPLIAADSLGIPNIWARISEKTTTRFKYKDYYSVFGINPQPYDLNNNSINPDIIRQNYAVDFEKVKAAKENLMSVMKKFFEETEF